MKLGKNLLGFLAAFIPRLQTGADKALVDGGTSVNQERAVGVGYGQRCLKLLLIGLHVIEVGVLRAFEGTKNDALVLLVVPVPWLSSCTGNRGLR